MGHGDQLLGGSVDAGRVVLEKRRELFDRQLGELDVGAGSGR